jgi:integrase
MPQRIFGTIEKLPSGRYRAKYVGPDKRRHKAPTTFIRKGDASGWLATEEAKIIANLWKPPSATQAANKITLNEYANRWWELHDLKSRTRSDYRKLLDQQILKPAIARGEYKGGVGLGELPLAAITTDHVRTWYAKLNKKTPTLRSHAYSLLRTILGTAVDERKIDFNPCVIKGAGSVKRAKKIRPATFQEIGVIVTSSPEKFQAMVLLAAWCAMRSGEVRELRRKNVILIEVKKDEWQGVVRIEQGVTYTKDDGYVVDTPKSVAGSRDVAIPPHIIPAIQHHLDNFTEENRNALLFPAKHGGHLATSSMSRWYEPARAAAGRPDLRFHDLRHSAAVLAAKEGATLKELMGRLGHSTPAAALIYQHVAAGRDQALAERMSKRSAAT